MSITNLVAKLFEARTTSETAFAELDKNQVAIDRVQHEQRSLEGAPPHRADLEAACKAWVARTGAQFGPTMAERVAPLVRDGRGLDDPRLIERCLGLAGGDGDEGSPLLLAAAMCAAVPAQLVDAMVNSLSLVSWSARAIPRAERTKKLATLKAREEELMAERQELLDACEKAGLRRRNPIFE